jgi:hypothetical protein
MKNAVKVNFAIVSPIPELAESTFAKKGVLSGAMTVPRTKYNLFEVFLLDLIPL